MKQSIALTVLLTIFSTTAASGNYRKRAERPHSARGRMEGLLMFDYRNCATDGIGALA